MGAGHPLTKKDMIGWAIAQECDCLPVSAAAATPSKAVGPMSQMMLDLQAARVEQVHLLVQVEDLNDQLGNSQAEVG